jgi:hypothetical protein
MREMYNIKNNLSVTQEVKNTVSEMKDTQGEINCWLNNCNEISVN